MSWEWRLLLENCTGCGICYDVCDFGAIRMEREMAYPEPISGRCTGCLTCARECPFGAIEVVRQEGVEQLE
jgi:heterodisulfide reductase subunit A